MEFCRNSTGIVELIVDGVLANVGIGIVSLFCVTSCERCPQPCSLLVVMVIFVPFLASKSEFIDDDAENWLPEAFSCNPDVFQTAFAF